MKSKHSLFALFVAAALSFGAVGSFVAISALAKDNFASLNQAAEGTYWSGLTTDGSQYGNTFRSALQTIMKNKQTTSNPSYSSDTMWNVLAGADESPLDSSYIRSFYADPSTTTYNVLKTNHGGTKGQWNKEHVWPNSRGAGESVVGNDPQMLRAAAVSLNSSRGNNMYAASGAYDPASEGYTAARGEAARIILYTATRYYQMHGTGSKVGGTNGLELTNNTSDATSNNTMGKLSDLLTWNNTYAVTTEEVKRNEYLTSAGYSRNPFIDHPDWANYIWDASGIRTSAYTPVVTSSSSATTSYSSSSKTSSSAVSSSSSISSSSSVTSSTYQLVTSASDLTVGSNYVVASVSSGSGYGMTGATKSTYYMGAGAVTVTSSTISDISAVAAYTLGGSSGAYTLKNGSNYLRGYVSGTYYDVGLATSTGNDTSWAISIASNGAATLQSASGTYLSFKSTTSYTEFAGSSSSATVYLFKEVSAASVAVTGVSLSASTASVNVGSTTTLTATVSPSDATNKSVTWSSSNTSIATVSSGVVSGVSAGNATITVTTADGGWTDTCTVTVSATTIDVTAVAVSFASSSIYVGQTTQANVAYTPSNATNKTGTWTSDDETVASVNSSGAVTAVGVGSTYINFESNDGPSDYALITVTAAPIVKTLSSIAVSGATASATFGSTYSISGLVVTATYSDGTTADVTASSTIDKPNTKVIGPQNVGVSYAEDSVTKTATYPVSVTTVGANQGSSATVYNGSIVPNVAVTDGTEINTAGGFTATGVTLSSFAETKTYGDGSSTQYRLGTSSASGSITFTLGSTIYLKSVTLNVAQYKTDSATVYVTDGTTTASSAISSSTTSLDFSSNWASNMTGTSSIKVYNTAKNNRFFLSGVTFTYTTTASSQIFTDAEEATAWATYFTTCTSGNCHGSTIWSTVNTQYTGMSDTAKAYFVAHESSDTTIKAAYDRYVFARAQYGLTDFIGGSSGSAASLAASNNASYWALGAVLSVFALTTIGYISFSFKKKHQ
jgi:uncharacterized protein YjdB/endonuclease I